MAPFRAGSTDIGSPRPFPLKSQRCFFRCLFDIPSGGTNNPVVDHPFTSSARHSGLEFVDRFPRHLQTRNGIDNALEIRPLQIPCYKHGLASSGTATAMASISRLTRSRKPIPHFRVHPASATGRPNARGTSIPTGWAGTTGARSDRRRLREVSFLGVVSMQPLLFALESASSELSVDPRPMIGYVTCLP